MFFAKCPSDAVLRTLLEARSDSAFTHSHEGVTVGSEIVAPKGFRLEVYGVEVGQGETDFARACEAVATFAHYPSSFTRVYSLTPRAEVGTVFGTIASHFGFASVHPCRILEVIDEPATRRFGFALGTLPGHIGDGEERFLVSLNEKDGRVRYDVRAVSRPHGALGRLGSPFFRHFQLRFQAETCAAMRSFVGGRSESSAIS